MLFEHASNLYRTFLPTPLWFRYLSNSHSSGVLFATVITALYVMIKGVVLFGKIKETYRAALSFVQDPVRQLSCGKGEDHRFISFAVLWSYTHPRRAASHGANVSHLPGGCLSACDATMSCKSRDGGSPSPPSLPAPCLLCGPYCSTYSVKTVCCAGLTDRALAHCVGPWLPRIPSGEMVQLLHGHSSSERHLSCPPVHLVSGLCM